MSSLKPTQIILHEAELLDEYPDLPICIHYLTLRQVDDEGQRMTVPQICAFLHHHYPDKMPSTIPGLNARIKRWKANGTFAKASEFIIAPSIEELRAATERIIEVWPKAVDKIIKDVIEVRSPRMRLEIMQWLWEEFIKPRSEAEQITSMLETKFLSKSVSDPMDVE